MTTLDAHVDLAPPSLVPDIGVELGGDLDIDSVLQLHEQLQDALSLRPERLVIGFERCSHLDAQAIGVLLDVHRSMWASGGRLVLRGCDGNVLRLLTLAGVDRVFELEASKQEPGASERR